MNTQSPASGVIGATTVCHMVMTAAAIAANTLTDTEQTPDARLRALMEAHGKVLAAGGIGIPLTFTEFRQMLSGDLSDCSRRGLLPPR